MLAGGTRNGRLLRRSLGAFLARRLSHKSSPPTPNGTPGISDHHGAHSLIALCRCGKRHRRSMHRSAVQDFPCPLPYPIRESSLPEGSWSISMTTVLTKAFPQEDPRVAKAALSRKRVLIIGGGFAGIAAAHALKRANVEITLIDRRNHHIFQPLLYQVATAVLSPAEIAAPIRQLEAKQKNLSVLLAEVKGINLGARTIEAVCPGTGSRRLEYDFLVIAAGMRPSYFGHDEFARFAPGLKSLNDAETSRAKIFGAF